MVPEEVKTKLALAWIAAGVLILWFAFGFGLPLLFENGYQDGGVFGDSFGSVNSLFTGLGFVGISYTIYLQIENSKDQRREHQFSLYIKLIDDLKSDLDNIEFRGEKGIHCFKALIRFVNPQYLNEFTNDFETYNNFLDNVNEQLNLILNQVEANTLLTKDQVHLLQSKIKQIYLVYLDQLYSVMRDKKPSNGKLLYLYITCQAMEERIVKLLTIDEPLMIKIYKNSKGSLATPPEKKVGGKPL